MQTLNPQQQKQRTYLTDLLNRIPKSEIQLQSKCAELLYFFYPDHWKRLVTVFNNSIRANTSGFGIVPGASDTYWLNSGGKTIFIEFKFGISGKQSDKQKEWQLLCELLGHNYVICRDENSFWDIINFEKPEINNILHLQRFL